MSSKEPRIVYQPLHPSTRLRLDPEYIAYHDSVLQYLPADDERPWTPSFRTWANIINTTPVAVGGIRDVTIPKLSPTDRSPLQARVFTPDPELSPPESANGWPVLLWFHGGGFVLGGLESENDLCALFCRTAGCVVVSVAYRLAPEHPYPAAAQDAVRALRWVASEEASRELGSDRQRIAIGGTSA
ncbi:hypothetical protein LTR84_003812 [Exophiala bonariae]|uniref:Alpha/beta hydrolase fold-3 domain-containing protein n=1 Tax=Exophiala bonariae TaxID=1690606 RepID=A0AAV9N6A1_9EURO|nr:hypothetical protein LTR84_003812 [Exophiala bonariae]